MATNKKMSTLTAPDSNGNNVTFDIIDKQARYDIEQLSETIKNLPTSDSGNIAFFITPEQYGAKGDGVTDDTQAFQYAIESGKPIICDGDKTYKFTGIISTRKTKVNINGNHCTFKGFRLKINLNDAEDNWHHTYPQPCSTIENIVLHCNDYDWCIRTGIPLEVKFVTVYNCDSFLKNYGSYMDYMVLDTVNIFYAKNNQYPIELSYLGDQRVFRNCHSSGGADDKFIQISGCSSALFENCLNGHYMIYASTAKFISCHLENQGTVECGDGNYINSNIAFDSCFFWDKYRILNRKGVSYENCTFLCTFDVVGQGLNDYLALDTSNCIVMCNTNGLTAQSHVLLDEYKRDVYDNAVWNTNKVVHSYQAITNSGKTWGIATGSYVYTFFPSSNPFSIEYSNFDYSKVTYNVATNSNTSGIQFNLDAAYSGMWVHCYRNSPNGKIQKCVLKVLSDRMYDYGMSMNGILWKDVVSIPSPQNSTAIYRNGIYYSDNGLINAVDCICTNTTDGTTVYVNKDGVKKLIGSGSGGSGSVITDTTLTQGGSPADAKAVGDKFKGLSIGKHTDGLIYIFINGTPVGSGLNIGNAGIEDDVVDELLAHLLLDLNSEDITSSSTQWNDRSGNDVSFNLSNGTPDITSNGLLMTSCKVHGAKPIALNGAFTYVVDISFENTGVSSAIISFNQNQETKYCDNLRNSVLTINGYSGGGDTTLSVPQNELIQLAIVRNSSGDTKVYKNGVLNGSYGRGTFNANGSFDLVLGASSWNGFPNHEGTFRIKKLKVYDVALTDDQIMSN